jgi:hypothetical protein
MDAKQVPDIKTAFAPNFFFCAAFSDANDPQNPIISLSPTYVQDQDGPFYTWLDVLNHRTKEGRVGAMLDFGRWISPDKVYLTFTNESAESFDIEQTPLSFGCLKPLTEVEVNFIDVE